MNCKSLAQENRYNTLPFLQKLHLPEMIGVVFYRLYKNNPASKAYRASDFHKPDYCATI